MPDLSSRAEQRRQITICLIAIGLILAIKAGLALVISGNAKTDDAAQKVVKDNRRETNNRVVRSVTFRDKQALHNADTATRNLRDGRMPQWRKNAVTIDTADDRPEIAIVIDDIGLKKRNSRAVMKLEGPLTLALLPYADKLEQQAGMARKNGHELLVHMPMQPKSRDINPGPNVLRADLAGKQLKQRLAKSLAAFDGYVGINNHMGSRFTADSRAMHRLMRSLSKRGLLYLDSLTTPDSVGAQAAAHHNVPYAARNVFLDHVATPASIRNALKQVERIAREQGRVIAIGHPKDPTIAALKQWMPKARDKGFQFVPVSALVQRMHKTAHMSKAKAIKRADAVQ